VQGMAKSAKTTEMAKSAIWLADSERGLRFPPLPGLIQPAREDVLPDQGLR